MTGVDRAALQALFLKYFSGKREQLREFLENFYQDLARDVLVGFFFTGKDLRSIADKQSSFLWKAAGLAPSYTGHAPSTAHLGLARVLDGHFDRRLLILESHLRRLGLEPGEIAVWIALENAFRGSIVGH